MLLYRICPERYLEDFSGLGASYQDGARWNLPGSPVMYFASTASLAMLELAHYLPSPRLVPKSYRLGIYTLPNTLKIEEWSVDVLPPDWKQYPYPRSTQEMGDDWLGSKSRVALSVPSAAVPGGLEHCVVVNSLHKSIAKLKLESTLTEIYSERLFSGIH